ncbi:MAG: hypothetical protein QM687_10780 [Ferruginibacter sp.]
MKHFFQKIFSISLFQAMIIAILALLKWLDQEYHFLPDISSPVKIIVILCSIILLLVVTLGMGGLIEDKYSQTEDQKKRHPVTAKLFVGLMAAAGIIPVLVFLLVLLYDNNTPLSLGVLLLAAIIFGNLLEYLKEKFRRNPSEEI